MVDLTIENQVPPQVYSMTTMFRPYAELGIHSVFKKVKCLLAIGTS